MANNNNPVYLGKGGNIVLEAENTRLQGSWKKTQIKGRSAVIYDGSNSFRKPQNGQTLSYTFETDEQGTYSIALYSARDKDAMEEYASDLGNDAFISFEEVATGKVVKAPTKLFTYFGNANSKFRWGTKFDTNHTKAPAEVSLKANTQYRLLISGRSDGYVIDRITLSNSGFLKKTNVPVSKVKSSAAEPAPEPNPVPDPVLTPEPIPTPKSLITLALVNAGTNQVVKGFENLGGQGKVSLDGLDLSKQYNLIAQVNVDHPDAGAVKSIKFQSDLGNRTESVAPYALFGDVGGDFLGKLLKPGSYGLKATAYRQLNGKGGAIATTTAQLAVVKPSASAPAPTPNPTQNLAPTTPKDLNDLGSALDPTPEVKPAPQEPKPTPDSTPDVAPVPNPAPNVVVPPSSVTPSRQEITGTAGDDLLIGVDLSQQAQFVGKGEKDILLGKKGADTFVLGNADGMFYDDGNSKTAGRQDFGRVIDFSLAQGDVIQLHGRASDYSLGALTPNNQRMVGIFAEGVGERELIGIINNGQGLKLDSEAFRFV